jgi:two-component sensor histidine kinase
LAVSIHKIRTNYIKKRSEELEVIVTERTAELTKTNVQLKEEIYSRKRAEKQIKASLREKEVLLREIHHRVKNNLQTIISLLNLQAGYIKDKRALEVFKNSQERVRAMALIHEKLYESKDLSKIDSREYISSLITSLLDSYHLNPGQVRLNMQIKDIELDIGRAIPLGLIINELVSNSLKHAFPDDRKGELQINLGVSEGKEYDYKLIVKDNGIGFPEDLDIINNDTLGMVLIKALIKQLRGVLDIDRREGTTFTINFKKLNHK